MNENRYNRVAPICPLCEMVSYHLSVCPAKGRIVVEKEWRQIRNPSLIQVALEIFCWHETTIYGII